MTRHEWYSRFIKSLSYGCGDAIWLHELGFDEFFELCEDCPGGLVDIKDAQEVFKYSLTLSEALSYIAPHAYKEKASCTQIRNTILYTTYEQWKNVIYEIKPSIAKYTVKLIVRDSQRFSWICTQKERDWLSSTITPFEKAALCKLISVGLCKVKEDQIIPSYRLTLIHDLAEKGI